MKRSAVALFFRSLSAIVTWCPSCDQTDANQPTLAYDLGSKRGQWTTPRGQLGRAGFSGLGLGAGAHQGQDCRLEMVGQRRPSFHYAGQVGVKYGSGEHMKEQGQNGCFWPLYLAWDRAKFSLT